MKSILSRALAVVFVSAILNACTSLLTPKSPMAAGPNPAADLTDWTLAGRLGVTQSETGCSAADCRKKGWSASLRWEQHGDDYQLDLVGPLGQGRIRVNGTAQGVTLTNADGEKLNANSADELVYRAVGMPVPVQGLQYWIRGLPDPARASRVEKNPAGQISRLEQDSWLVDIPQYRQVATLNLPRKLNATQNNISVKLVINNWDIAP